MPRQASSGGKVVALVGGQFGSEGKGVIAAHIANLFNVHVRTGGPNAGHTFFFQDRKWVMQSVPCGWINPMAMLVIGAGGLMDVDQLCAEIDMIYEADPSIVDRLVIDSQCGVISEWHKIEEGGTKGEMHKRIGSTGKGVGAARRDRVMRDPDKFLLMKDFLASPSPAGHPWKLGDLIKDNTYALIEDARSLGNHVLLEGTQGSGLSLIHSFWPYATSQDTNAAQLAADAGIAPNKVTGVILVCRTYPIRVAGNSGPLQGETDWDYISRRVGKPVQEKTTVTKKIRRIGTWDEALVSKSVLLNDPSYLAITFMDYLAPESEGASEFDQLSPRAKGFIHYAETVYGTPVAFIGTGGPEFQVIDKEDPEGIIK